MLPKIKQRGYQNKEVYIMPDKGKSKSASTKNKGKKGDKKIVKNKGPKK